MAIEPWDARLPRAVTGCQQTVYRKKSKSKAITLHLLHRDIWSNAQLEYWKRHCKQQYVPQGCSNRSEDCWNPELPPNCNGYIEGIAQVNPWLLEKDTEVFAKVEARHRLYRSEVEDFDFEIDEVAFAATIRLNPPVCAEHGRECFVCPPADLGKYSAELRLLYEKLGGPASSKVLQKENLSRNGVLLNKAFHNRHAYTVVPHTTATATSGTPCHPYVTFNFPFRFDINPGPDSICIKSNPPPASRVYTVPKGRQELLHDAIYGFAYPLSDSDPEPPSSSDDDDMYVPRIRHPRQIKQIKRHDQRKINYRKQDYKDLFHIDSYPWHPRSKLPPKAGIFWTASVFTTGGSLEIPDQKNTAVLKVRKLSYLPSMPSIHNKLPQTISMDYTMLVGPVENSDAGVITLVGKLDKIVYSPSEPVIVTFKIHNNSNRVIQQITVEVNQCTRIHAWTNRVWRTTICKRQITAENATAQMPILPFTEQLIMSTRLNPWPVEQQMMHMFSDKYGTPRKIRIPKEPESFNIQMPKTPNAFYGIQQRPRYEEVPLTFILRKRPAFSTLPGVVECMMDNDLNDKIIKPDCCAPYYPRVWCTDPHGKCCCHRGPVDLSGAARTCHNPPMEPYQLPINPSNNIHDYDEDRDPQIARINEIAPRCAQCGGCKPTPIEPMSINYEVVVYAVLRPQHTADPLGQDVLLKQMQLSTGLMFDPKGDIEGKNGPRISLPLIFTVKCPQPEKVPTVANCNIDQRQNRLPRFPPPPQVWEPSQGKGLLIKPQLPPAPCLTREEALLAAMKV